MNLVKTLSLKELASASADFNHALYSGLSQCGFVIIKDHGIPKELLEQAYSYAEQLFALSSQTKQQYSSENGGHRGYTAFGMEKAVGQTNGDLKEFWHIGRSHYNPEFERSEYPENHWPVELEGFKACFEQLYTELENLGLKILSAIGEGLGGYGDILAQMAINGNSVCRLLHYPPVELKQGPLSMRAAPHADINLLTLLVGASDSGLQLLDKDSNWVAVESEPDEIVVDTGDMMARLTNNRLPSTIHRVVNESKGGGSRYSMPFFLHPRSDVTLAALPNCADGTELPPINAGDFLAQRLKQNGF